MYKRTRPADFLLAISVLVFAAFWNHVFYSSRAAVAPQQSSAALHMSDDAIRAQLVGFWIVPRSEVSADDDIDLRTVREFDAGGEGQIYVYADTACTDMASAKTFQWNIKDGFLESHFEGTPPERNQIISIDQQSFVFRSAHGDDVHRRDKGASCFRS